MSRILRIGRPPQIDMKRLRGQLFERRITQVQFAERIGISSDWFNMLVNGHHIPSELTLWKIATAATDLGLDGVVLWSGPRPDGTDGHEVVAQDTETKTKAESAS